MTQIKKIIFTLFISFLAVLNAQAVTVKGSFKNAGAAYIFLFRGLGSEFYKVDSVKHAAGEFKFKLGPDFPRGFYLIGPAEAQAIFLILGKEDLAVTADLKNLPASIRITNSKENEAHEKMKVYNTAFNLQQKELETALQGLTAERESNPEKFKTEVGKLQVKYDSMDKARNTFYKKLSEENKDLFVGKLASSFVVADSVNKDNFFKPNDFKDVELTTGDILSAKLGMYLQRFIPAQLEYWKTESENLTSKIPAGSKQREVAYLTFIKLFTPYDASYARRLAVTYINEFPKSVVAKKVLALTPAGPPSVGDVAPEIKLSDPDGKIIPLSSLKGKVVLLDFWASWCGPCRMENPNVVNVYNKYKDKGCFTIYSVSLDNSKTNWMNAIQKDGLVWKSHVSDLKGWQSSAAALYQVKGIPATFLLDKEGKIVATNLRGEVLEQKLSEFCQ